MVNPPVTLTLPSMPKPPPVIRPSATGGGGGGGRTISVLVKTTSSPAPGLAPATKDVASVPDVQAAVVALRRVRWQVCVKPVMVSSVTVTFSPFPTHTSRQVLGARVKAPFTVPGPFTVKFVTAGGWAPLVMT
jgi:hypothetical protein